MGKYWAIFFGVTMLGCLGLFMVAPFVEGWWLHEGMAKHDGTIIRLFLGILYLTAFAFVATEAILVAFMFRYGTQSDGTPPKPGPSITARLIRPLANLLNEPHIELAWTIVPAAILLVIAFVQVDTWANVKYQSRYEQKGGVVIEVSARQFEFRMRYPSKARAAKFLENEDKAEFLKFGKLHFDDDVKDIVNELHLVKDQPVLVHLSTLDVIHGFNLPNFYVKQDALPGRVIPVWFVPVKANTIEKDGKWVDGYNWETEKENDRRQIWELACSQLCGWGHANMVGRLYVHKDKADFLNWLEHAGKAQNKRD